MKKLIFIFLAVLFMTFPAFLGSARDACAAEPIKIGAILDFTGPVADLGPKFKAGIELALEEAGYKVAGREIKLIVEDGATDVRLPSTSSRKWRIKIRFISVSVRSWAMPIWLLHPMRRKRR